MDPTQNNNQPKSWSDLLGAGAGGILGGLFGNNASYNDPMGAASQYYNQIMPQANAAAAPWINAGRGALGDLQGRYSQLLNDPTAIMSQIGAGYKQSPGYQFQVDQATGAANRAAAAGGQSGSAFSQEQLAGLTNNLADQDYYKYLDMGLGQYGQGLQGEQGIMQQGAGMQSSIIDLLSNLLGTQGNMAFANANNQNQRSQANAGGIGGGIGDVIGGLASKIFGG